MSERISLLLLDDEPIVGKRMKPALTKIGCDVEFFSDETEVECSSCGRTLHREASPSCVSWCEYASKCIADLVERKLVTPSRAEELMKMAEKTNE